MPIFLEFAMAGRKPHNPFKFNSNWLLEDDYVNWVKESWLPFNKELRESVVL
jgi:hypothetical protein